MVSGAATAPANWELMANIILQNIPQNDFRFLGEADSPPKPFIPSNRKGYIVMETQYGHIPAKEDSSCLYIT